MSKVSVLHQAVGLVCWLILTFVAAGIGAMASTDAGTFYAQLVRPSWAPPAWLFAPVWGLLYFLMAISAWLVWRMHGLKKGRIALGLFTLQLGANALWSWVFFVWHRGAVAFAEVVVLWVLILATVVSFRRFSAVAAALLLPYLAWVTFASALTFAAWRLNPGLL